jgi:acyl-coenzyme A synthetase/AMP-(fatty) acid ligase
MCCRVISSAETLVAGGTVGSPIDGLTLDAFDDDMTRCPPGEAGKIFVKGAHLFAGYVGGQSMSPRLSHDDWFETGDYGHRTLDGDIVLQGRSDDVFKVAGVKASAVVIAEALLSSGTFADVAVVPRPHPRVGSVPHVYYVPSPLHSFSLQKTMRHLREQLPSCHLPWGFTEVSAIPRTGSGKIDRRALRSAVGNYSSTPSN